jgi:hypothetical protein
MIYHSEYIRICKDCAASFRTDRPKKQYCPDCAARRYKESVKKYNQSCKAPKYQKPKASKKKYKKPALSIAQVCRLQKLYNENNKTFLSYGDIVRKIESGEIEVIITEGAISYVPKD